MTNTETGREKTKEKLNLVLPRNRSERSINRGGRSERFGEEERGEKGGKGVNTKEKGRSRELSFAKMNNSLHACIVGRAQCTVPYT